MTTLIFANPTSKVVCGVITARLPPASEAHHVSLIFCVQLLHISPHREQCGFTYHVTEAEHCSRAFPDQIIPAFILASNQRYGSRNAYSPHTNCVDSQQSRNIVLKARLLLSYMQSE